MDGLIISSFSYFVLHSDLCSLFGLYEFAVGVPIGGPLDGRTGKFESMWPVDGGSA